MAELEGPFALRRTPKQQSREWKSLWRFFVVPFSFFDEVMESPFSDEAGGGGLTVTEESICGLASDSTPPPPGSSFLTWVMTESMMMAVLPAWGEAEAEKTPLTRAAPSSLLLSGRIQTCLLVHQSTISLKLCGSQWINKGYFEAPEKPQKAKLVPIRKQQRPKCWVPWETAGAHCRAGGGGVTLDSGL